MRRICKKISKQLQADDHETDSSSENEEQQLLLPQPRRAKLAANLEKNWIENSDSEIEEEFQFPPNCRDLDQLDGEIETPNSLTPDSSPVKSENLDEAISSFKKKRAVRIISDFYVNVLKTRMNNNQLAIKQLPFEDVDLDTTDSSDAHQSEPHRTSDDNYSWDNYASDPNLTGSPWQTQSHNLEPDEQIFTQYYFNRAFNGQIPNFARRTRAKSMSENDS